MSFSRVASLASAQTPKVGEKAPDFTLVTPTGASVALAKVRAKGATVLVLLRGFPGYPTVSSKYMILWNTVRTSSPKRRTSCLFTPAPQPVSNQQAKEFLAKQADLPSNVKLVVDPDCKRTIMYGLRWGAPHEIAYPSTFVLDARDRSFRKD